MSKEELQIIRDLRALCSRVSKLEKRIAGDVPLCNVVRKAQADVAKYLKGYTYAH